MKGFSIEYNPYTVECIFRKEGKELGPQSKFSTKRNERLQAILSPNKNLNCPNKNLNWDGLLEEIGKSCNTREIKLTFKGRRIDFDDLRYCVDHYEGEKKFTLELIEGKNDQDIIRELNKTFAEIRKKKLPDYARTNKQGKDINEAYEEVKNGIFSVNVIATMSSGKSTLLNALLHTELLPSKNAACTATIAEITDDDLQKEFTATCYGKDHKTVIYPRVLATKENLDRYNSDEKVAFIDITGDIPAVSSDKIHLRLRDTPGPNNSRNENHKKRTDKIIKDTNAVVLYVMNAAQQSINDDAQLLKDISEEMRKNGKQSRDRFIFVLNKCDNLDEEKGETLDKALNDARVYLNGFGIDDPILIPTSALKSLLIRRIRAGAEFTRKERRELNFAVEDFVETELLHFENYAVLTPTVKDALRKQVEEYHANKDTWDLEADIHTGIPALEATIAEYIDKYAYPIKIKDAIKDISAILGDICQNCNYVKMISESEEARETAIKDIEKARGKQQDIENTAKDFKEEIDSFNLGDLNSKAEKNKIQRTLVKITTKYEDKKTVDKADAYRMIMVFQSDLVRLQENCEGELRRNIERGLFDSGNEMMEEYRSRVAELLGNIQIEGYDFEKVYSFQKARIDNISDLIRQNETTRYKDETRWKKNPKREGFLGFLKFWEPKEISYTVQVEDGKNVNVAEVISKMGQDFERITNENIDKLFKQADEQVTGYKAAFKANIEDLQQEISKLLDEIGETTKNIDELTKNIDELAKNMNGEIVKNRDLLDDLKSDNEERLIWATDMKKRLETLTDF